MVKLLKMVEVTGIPHEGHEGYCRAGRRWTRTPAQVEVVKLGEGDTLAANQITIEQFKRLDADERIKVRVVADDSPKDRAPSQESPKA